MSAPSGADAAAVANANSSRMEDEAQTTRTGGEGAQAALNGLLARSSLSESEFVSGGYADVLRACQQAGDCSQFQWESIRQLILLRLQNVYESYLTSDRSGALGSDDAWMCAACRKSVLDASTSAESKANAIANAHCRRSEVEEEPPHVTLGRIRQGILQFYKPPFTVQRMCDLLLEPRRYCKTTNKFLLAFAKLVCGIQCDVPEDSFNVNWNEQKDAAVGVPAVHFVTREEDEFTTATNFVPAAHFPSAASDAGSSASTVSVHALLSPQHHRVGMSAAELAAAQEREAQARQQIDNRGTDAATTTQQTETSGSAANGTSPMETAE